MGGDTSQICHLLLVRPPFAMPINCVKRPKRFLLVGVATSICLSRVMTMVVHIGYDGAHDTGTILIRDMKPSLKSLPAISQLAGKY